MTDPDVITMAERFRLAVQGAGTYHEIDGWLLVIVADGEAAIATGGCDETAEAACEAMARKLQKQAERARG